MLTRTHNGEHQARFGGYVSYDTNRKNDFGTPIRETEEVAVWLSSDIDESDCGWGTEQVTKALEAKISKRFKKTDRNVECRESWRY